MHKVDQIWRSKPRKQLDHPLQLVTHIGAADSGDIPGLQAADFLAWHVNRGHKTGDPWPNMISLFAAPNHARYFDYDAMVEMYGRS